MNSCEKTDLSFTWNIIDISSTRTKIKFVGKIWAQTPSIKFNRDPWSSFGGDKRERIRIYINSVLCFSTSGWISSVSQVRSSPKHWGRCFFSAVFYFFDKTLVKFHIIGSKFSAFDSHISFLPFITLPYQVVNFHKYNSLPIFRCPLHSLPLPAASFCCYEWI
jgi:hypothetical protein